MQKESKPQLETAAVFYCTYHYVKRKYNLFLLFFITEAAGFFAENL